jgi:uncharacterized OsmC-like protein
MDASELRELQRPLKQRYRDDPASARTSAHSEGIVDVGSLTCRIVGPPGDTVAGLHPAAGGSGELACSADLLLDALVACAGVTLAAVATSMSIEVRTARVSADGWWDARGTLGVDRDAPVGLTDVALHFSLDTDAEPEKVARLVELTERYCVVAQTLTAPAALNVTLDIVGSG